MVETWQWTPLVMLIVLGGIAGLPADPYEAAIIDGASGWQMFRYITVPLVWPFIVVAAVIRMIDALKTFDTIYVITNGGPGTSSETINICCTRPPSPTTTSATPRRWWWCSSSSSC